MTAEPQWKIKTAPESRRAVFAAALVVIAGQAWGARSLRLDPFWLLPAISTALLIASLAVYESQDEPGRAARALNERRAPPRRPIRGSMDPAFVSQPRAFQAHPKSHNDVSGDVLRRAA